MSMTSTTEEKGAPVNTEHLRRTKRERLLTWVMPINLLIIAIGMWEFLVWYL